MLWQYKNDSTECISLQTDENKSSIVFINYHFNDSTEFRILIKSLQAQGFTQKGYTEETQTSTDEEFIKKNTEFEIIMSKIKSGTNKETDSYSFEICYCYLRSI